MAGLGDTLSRLAALRLPGMGEMPGAGASRLTALSDGPEGPGALRGWYFVPEHAVSPPLVVVLHGCTQNAAAYDRGSGWSDLAERYGFALLYPEQQRANNPNLCFNWFQPEDTRRGGGEVESIRGMIARMVAEHGVDPARLFVTGLSAGGAMASAMLACHPELFVGGAIIAGLPFGAARSVSEAMDRMRGHGHDAARQAAALRAASDHPGSWPAVSVWHGSADATVHPDNAAAILDQWRGVHGLAVAPDIEELVDGQRHRAWHDAKGQTVLEEYSIAGMGHGTPIAGSGARAAGHAGPYMLDAGISSTWHIAARWNLLNAAALGVASARRLEPVQTDPVAYSATPTSGVQATIEAAFRSAGLLR